MTETTPDLKEEPYGVLMLMDEFGSLRRMQRIISIQVERTGIT